MSIPEAEVHPLDVQRAGLAPPLTTSDRELVSVLEDKSEALGSNPRPLSPRSVTANFTRAVRFTPLRKGMHGGCN